jgi:hypothetical protein
LSPVAATAAIASQDSPFLLTPAAH